MAGQGSSHYAPGVWSPPPSTHDFQQTAGRITYQPLSTRSSAPKKTPPQVQVSPSVPNKDSTPPSDIYPIWNSPSPSSPLTAVRVSSAPSPKKNKTTPSLPPRIIEAPQPKIIPAINIDSPFEFPSLGTSTPETSSLLETPPHRPSIPVGSIHLVLGPMMSGKTTELLRLFRRHRLAKQQCLLVRFQGDDRYSAQAVATHGGDSETDCVSCFDLAEISETISDHPPAHIFIDEGQFYPHLHHFVTTWADQGINITISALDGDSNQKHFPEIEPLRPLVEKETKLTAICPCGKEAPFTIDVIGHQSGIITIGGAERYRPVCRGCLKAFRQKSTA